MRRPPLSQLVGAAVVLFAAGASVAIALWLALFGGAPRLLRDNAMASADRSHMLAVAAGAGLLVCAVGGGELWRRRTRSSLLRMVRAARIATPFTLAFALPFLFDWRAFSDDRPLFVASATLFGLALERTLRLAYREIPWPEVRGAFDLARRAMPRLAPRLPALAVGLMVALVAAYLSYYAVLRHYRLETHSYDLAIFDNLMWNLLRGEWFKASPNIGETGSHIQNHATFSAYLLVPLYALRQKADTLLVIQAVLCAGGAIPVYLVAKRRLASAGAALALAYAYLVFAPLHGPLFYDFHFLTLAPLFVGWVLYFFETGRRGWLLLAWLLAIGLREEVSALLAMAGLFYLLCGKRPRWALLGALASGLYFVLVTVVIMPAHVTVLQSDEAFAWMYQDLMAKGEQGYGAVLRTLLSNPLYVLRSLLTEHKALFALQILGPLLLLPLRHGRAWLLLLAPAAFTVLATDERRTVLDTAFQYSASWTAVVFVAAAAALASWRGRPEARIRIAAALSALVVVSTAFSYQYGALLQTHTFRGGFSRVRFTVAAKDHQRHQELYRLIALIPADASVAATETLAPHVSARENCFTLRYDHGGADYLLVDLGAARRGPVRLQMDEALGTGQYGFVAAQGSFALWGKGHSASRNDEGAALLDGKRRKPRPLRPAHE